MPRVDPEVQLCYSPPQLGIRGILMTALFAALGVLLHPSSALAIPHGNILVTPDRVSKAQGRIRVEYTIPCTMNDASRVVMSNDDTGDQVVAVGVVVSLEDRNCHPGPARRFTETVDPKAHGYSIGDEFEPMPSGGDKDRDLERYVRTRLAAAQDLISADARAPMRVKAETLRCMGYSSWEGNGKAVGACLVEASRACMRWRWGTIRNTPGIRGVWRSARSPTGSK
jgi:hypothetical protein